MTQPCPLCTCDLEQEPRRTSLFFCPGCIAYFDVRHGIAKVLDYERPIFSRDGAKDPDVPHESSIVPDAGFLSYLQQVKQSMKK